MTQIFDEQGLRFAFDRDWHVVKWDAHAAYTEGIRKLSGTKAVDFVGIHQSKPWFIEVTDFRERRIETKRQLTSGQLAAEVASKVRDTLAGLVWACGRAPLDEHELAALVGPLVNRDAKVPIVVWIEEDHRPSGALLSALKREIERALRWLNPKVLITSRSFAEQRPLPGLSVTSLPRPS